MTDLFLKQSMRQRVIDFCRRKGFITSVDLEIFKDEIKAKEGIVDGLLRIHRTARDLVKDKILRRLEKDEKRFRNFPVKFAVYEFIKYETPSP